MKPKQDAWTVVIVGCWNRMIFMPKWVSENLFDVPEIQKLVPIMPIAPLIYRTDEISLFVEDQKLVVQARQPTLECLQKMETMAVTALDKLPVTPISAMGLNFGFVEAAPSERLLKLFNFGDDVDIGSLGWDIGTRNLVRQLTRGKAILNLKLSSDSKEVEIHANFHTDVASASDAVNSIKGKIIDRYKECKKLLADVYGLRAEEEEKP